MEKKDAQQPRANEITGNNAADTNTDTDNKQDWLARKEQQAAQRKKENELNKLSLEEHYEYYKELGFEKKEIIKKIAKDRNLSKNEVYMHFV